MCFNEKIINNSTTFLCSRIFNCYRRRELKNRDQLLDVAPELAGQVGLHHDVAGRKPTMVEATTTTTTSAATDVDAGDTKEDVLTQIDQVHREAYILSR